jgi:hypothetical protein
MTLVFFAIFFVCAIGSFFIFDLFLSTQYDQHREKWIQDGMPHGFFFFRPKESYGMLGVPKFSSWIAMQSRFLTLNFKTPTWIATDSSLRKFIWLSRLLQTVGLLSWVGFAVFGFA